MLLARQFYCLLRRGNHYSLWTLCVRGRGSVWLPERCTILVGADDLELSIWVTNPTMRRFPFDPVLLRVQFGCCQALLFEAFCKSYATSGSKGSQDTLRSVVSIRSNDLVSLLWTVKPAQSASSVRVP